MAPIVEFIDVSKTYPVRGDTGAFEALSGITLAVEAGTMLYVANCVFCHGVPGVDRGGNIPNLGYMDASYIENLPSFVFKGPAMARGMPDFTGKLSGDDVESIKAFIQGTADAIRPKP